MGFEGGCQIHEGVPNSEGGESPLLARNVRWNLSLVIQLVLCLLCKHRLHQDWWNLREVGIIFCHFCDYVTASLCDSVLKINCAAVVLVNVRPHHHAQSQALKVY